MAEKRDYYEVLGVPKNASDADIKKNISFRFQVISSGTSLRLGML